MLSGTPIEWIHPKQTKSVHYTPEHVSGAERGASEERSVQNIVGARSGFLSKGWSLAPVPLRYRSHHEPRACTNPPRIHLCLQQLTKPSAYSLLQKSFVVKERWSSLNISKSKPTGHTGAQFLSKKIDDNVEHDQEYGDIYVLFWLMLLLLWVLYMI